MTDLTYEPTDAEIEAACAAYFDHEYFRSGFGWAWRRGMYGDQDPALPMMRAALKAAAAVRGEQTK